MQSLEAKCQCGQELTISGFRYEIVNQESFCGVILNHHNMTGNVCPACGAAYLFVIAGFDPKGLLTKMIPLPKKDAKPHIITDLAAVQPKGLKV